MIAWFVIGNYNMKNAGQFSIPDDILRRLVERGWIGHPGPIEGDGRSPAELTCKGRAVYDMNCADLGIRPEYVEVEE